MQEFDCVLNDVNSGLDASLTCASKRAVTKFIRDNENMIVEENTLASYIEAGGKTIDGVVEEILQMGECTEGEHITLGVLPNMLGFNCTVSYMIGDMETMECTMNTIDASLNKIHVLLSTNHYDLLFK